MFNVRRFSQPMFTERQVNLMNDFRELWSQHVYWTRMFLISNVNDLPDLDVTTNRLLRNPKDFAAVFQKFFGLEKAEKFDKLFTEHLTIAADFVNAAKAGNNMEVEKIRRLWFKNADDIAKFLSEINPYWSEEKWRSMLYDHLRTLENEATQMLNGAFEKSVNTFDGVENQALIMADYMSKGIIQQFKV